MGMNRRDYLRVSGGIGAASIAAGAGLVSLTGGAAATADFSYDPVTITSDDGTVQYVAIFGDSVVAWDGFDTPAQYFSIVIQGRLLQSGTEQASVTLYDGGLVDLASNWGGSGENLSGPGTHGQIESNVGYSSGSKDLSVAWEVVAPDSDGDGNGDPADASGLNSYGLPQEAIPASALTTGTDGGSTDYVVELESTYTWYDSGKAELFSKAWTSQIPVTVNNQATTASSGSGSQTDGATGG